MNIFPYWQEKCSNGLILQKQQRKAGLMIYAQKMMAFSNIRTTERFFQNLGFFNKKNSSLLKPHGDNHRFESF